MIDFLLAVGFMIVVVGLLLAWVVRADRRRRLESGESPRTRTEEVA